MLKPYTVLLLRPDYVTDNYGLDTYLAHAWAKDGPGQAVQTARAEAVELDCPGSLLDGADPDDYAVLAVFEGHLNDLNEGY